MIKRLYFLDGEGNDPYVNLGLEEYLLRRTEPEECILYLWQNENTVVIGRNQNAWRECNTDRLEEDGGRLARRLSGGGAVFHDLGNLNFTFLVRRENYDIARQTGVILEAVKSLGLKAIRTGRNDITVDGRKFSGNAYYETGNFCCHHGTILLSTDTRRMSRYLNVSKEKLESNGVDSVKSRVVNLCDFLPDLTVSLIRQRIKEGFGAVYGLPAEPFPKERLYWDQVKSLRDHYASWEWRYGRKIPFTDSAVKRFSWGELEIWVQVNEGSVRDLKLSTDALDTETVLMTEERLKGCPWSRAAVRERFSMAHGNESGRKMVNDIEEMICSMI